MSAEHYVSVDGKQCTDARVTVGYAGPWHATVHLPFTDPLPTPVTLQIGAMTLAGTVTEDGVFGLQRRARIVGGAAGWGAPVTAARAYHNDAGVKARLVADDMARDAGETIGTFIPAVERIGADYARVAGVPASSVLTGVIGRGVAWWIDYAGITHVGARATGEADATRYEVLAFDPSEQIATLTADDPSIVTAGMSIPQGVIRELHFVAGGDDRLRITAWVGGADQQPGRLAGLMTAIAQRATATDHTWGVWRYRVVTMLGDGRVDLQSVRRSIGLPDLTMIAQWPGVPGTHAVLALGSEVLVSFIEGDRAQPVLVGYLPDGAPTQLTIGGDAGPLAARQGDSVEVFLPPAIFSGTIGGTPASGLLTFGTNKALGLITTGSAKVHVA